MIFLHHYPASLFSEKIRLLLGHYDLAWQSVEISSIMPRPLLMPLSGGYRRTPVLQIGANIYADTKVISAALARHVGDDELYSGGFLAHRTADWADSQLFRVVVALNFRPEAMATMMGQFSEAEAQAFAKDRAELSGDQPIAGLSPTAAMACLSHSLAELETTLRQNEPYLLGDCVSIADFSVYHNLWFLNQNPVNRPLIDGYSALQSWMKRMRDKGHGAMAMSDGQAALDAAGVCRPTTFDLQSRTMSPFKSGDLVTVTPVDYGCVPVEGRFVAADHQEIIVERDTQVAGVVHNHFPQAGFDLVAV